MKTLKTRECGHSEQEAAAWAKTSFKTQPTVDAVKQLIRAEKNKRSRRSRGKAVDLGCGAGKFLPDLSASFVEVVGVDLSDAALSLARKQRVKNSRLKLIKADYFDTRLPPAYFDFALAVGPSIMGTSDYPKGLRELARLLKPGGRALLEIKNPLHASYWLPVPWHNFREKKKCAIWPWQARSALERGGFVVERIETVNYVPPACPRFAARFFYWLGGALRGFPFLGWFGRSTLAVARKPPK